MSLDPHPRIASRIVDRILSDIDERLSRPSRPLYGQPFERYRNQWIAMVVEALRIGAVPDDSTIYMTDSSAIEAFREKYPRAAQHADYVRDLILSQWPESQIEIGTRSGPPPGTTDKKVEESLVIVVFCGTEVSFRMMDELDKDGMFY